MAKVGTAQAERIAKSPIIFIGSVVKPGGSNVAVVPAGKGVATVRVEEALKAPPQLGLRSGVTVTLRLAKGAVKRGLSATFYATSWIFADAIALTELDRTVVGKAPRGPIRAQIADVLLARQDRALLDRLTGATLVVSGRVVAITPAPREAGQQPEEADWHVARVIVTSVEAGKLRGSAELAVHFPRSHDAEWERAPKLLAGQTGVFLLSDSVEDDDVPEGYTALDPIDVQASNQVDRVRALLLRNR
jgi:hypothetical protein